MKQKLILIIDDDLDDTELFCEVVDTFCEHYRCVMKSCCSDALYYLKETSPLFDIIFLDINMPCISGKECLQALKQDPSFKKIPVIFIVLQQK